ncbi:hypothetical protein B296_00053735 [Ensete ventricosum]|uniref:Uncharacterized protein n=1 Tax=Ensete ventricosum TaxID=4639 RepID=A0A426Y6P4_ENSVE|nr:hypothetical protein B296_00053735 [Ensete ventricosum]
MVRTNATEIETTSIPSTPKSLEIPPKVGESAPQVEGDQRKTPNFAGLIDDPTQLRQEEVKKSQLGSQIPFARRAKRKPIARLLLPVNHEHDSSFASPGPTRKLIPSPYPH